MEKVKNEQEEGSMDDSSLKMAEVYLFLSSSMKYPEENWKETGCFTILSTFLEQFPWEDEKKQLNEKLDSSNWLETLQVEYTRLFINSTPHVIAPPYGSIYYSEDGILYGKSTERVKQFYKEKGYEFTNDSELPDHLVFELEFLSLLAGEDNENEEEEYFLNKFFRPWFGKFRDRILSESHHPYYRMMVKLIDFFTKEEV
jgi:putative dimethyl sulfoxide reductase chaperone